jgi:hypothetical protein
MAKLKNEQDQVLSMFFTRRWAFLLRTLALRFLVMKSFLKTQRKADQGLSSPVPIVVAYVM